MLPRFGKRVRFSLAIANLALYRQCLHIRIKSILFFANCRVRRSDVIQRYGFSVSVMAGANQGKRMIKGFYCLVLHAIPMASVSDAHERLPFTPAVAQIGIESKSLLQVLDRFLVIADTGIHHSEIVQGASLAAHECRRPAYLKGVIQILDCLRTIAKVEKGASDVIQRL